MLDDIYEIFIVFTRNCNLNCSYCYENKSNKKIDKYTLDKIIKFIKDRKKIHKINLFGGEPFLEPDLINYFIDNLIEIKNETDREFIIFTNTNVTIFNKKIENLLNKISENFLFYCVLSIDGNEKCHDKYRITKDGKPTYNLVINNFKKIKNNCPKVKFGYNSVITPEMAKDFYNIVKSMIRNPFFLGGVFQYIEQIDENKEVKYNIEDLENVYKTIMKLNKEGYSSGFLKERFDNLISTLDYRYNNFYKDKEYCAHGNSIVTIDYDGKIYQCTRYLGLDYEELKKYCIYDLISGYYNDFNNTFKEIIDIVDKNSEQCNLCPTRFSCCICTASIEINKLCGFKKECNRNYSLYEAAKNVKFTLK